MRLLLVGSLGLALQACVVHDATPVNQGYGYGYGYGYQPAVQGSVSVSTPSAYAVSSMPPEPLYETMTASPGFRPQNDLSAAINGGGTINARAVDAVEVSAAVNGGGRIFVRPRATLSAAVHGGGEIRYGGNPQVSMAVAGGGDVRRD